MRKWKITNFFVALLIAVPTAAFAGTDFGSNVYQVDELHAVKKPLDDPRPLHNPEPFWKKDLRKDTWEAITCDPEKAKALWAEVRGFTTPEVVGKVAPEIKPGKYTLADKTRLPFKELMIPAVYEMFNEPGANGKNLALNFTEFEVMPPRQMYHHTAVSEATLKNNGMAKLQESGYITKGTVQSGYPFPRPSGPQAGWQILYNSSVEPQHYYDDFLSFGETFGFNRNFKIDYRGAGYWHTIKLGRRVKVPPLGWYDKQAEKQGQRVINYFDATAPRDYYGNAYLDTSYFDPEKLNNMLFYMTMTRRIRKMSAGDRQDQALGMDLSYDDGLGFSQKLLPDLYPYEVKLLGEKEFLAWNYPRTGKTYVDTKAKGLWRNLEFERRPVYILEMKQLDPAYIYSKRILYIDKETFVVLFAEMYDQKDRLWRTWTCDWMFTPETGSYNYFQGASWDHIDQHMSYAIYWEWAAQDIDRSQFSPKRLMRSVK